jgi:hypothetical protein
MWEISKIENGSSLLSVEDSSEWLLEVHLHKFSDCKEAF